MMGRSAIGLFFSLSLVRYSAGFLASKAANDSSGLEFCNFFYSYFVRSFLPFSVVESKGTEGYRLQTNNNIY